MRARLLGTRALLELVTNVDPRTVTISKQVRFPTIGLIVRNFRRRLTAAQSEHTTFVIFYSLAPFVNSFNGEPGA